MRLITREAQIALIARVLEYPVRDGVRLAFSKMSDQLEGGQRSLTVKQIAWIRVELDKHEPQYENLVSSGAVAPQSYVRLMVYDHPAKPPGYRRQA